jgi:hypothetical protein
MGLDDGSPECNQMHDRVIAVPAVIAERLCLAVAKQRSHPLARRQHRSRRMWKEAQDAAMDLDPWPSGLAANRRNLDDFVRYSMDQRLIDMPVEVEQMFHESSWNS